MSGEEGWMDGDRMERRGNTEVGVGGRTRVIPEKHLGSGSGADRAAVEQVLQGSLRFPCSSALIFAPNRSEHRK